MTSSLALPAEAQSAQALYDGRYTAGYRETLSSYEVARWRALAHFIPKVARLSGAQRVLDFGCGSGLFAPLWRLVFPEATLHFVDISSVAIDQLRHRFPEHRERSGVFDIDNRAPFQDCSFDAIVSVEVLEHVENLAVTLREVARLLAPGGAFVWTTPCANAGSIEHIFAGTTGQIEQSRTGERRWRWEEPTHLRRLTTRQMRQAMRGAGLRTKEIRHRAHLFSFLCDRLVQSRFPRLSERLMTLDYRLFRRAPCGASILGVAHRDGRVT